MASRERIGVDDLRRHFGHRPFRVSEAIEFGFSRTTLHRLQKSGAVETAARGLLQVPGSGMGALSTLAIVSARVPHGTICLNSALAYWDLTDEIPDRVHIAVPRGTHRPRIRQPRSAVHVFDPRTSAIERVVERTDVDEPFWVYSAERSIVDAIRMARWVGKDVGLHALRRYIARRGADPARLTELAGQIGGRAALQPSLQALLS